MTLGDPRGIGPEVASAALRELRAERPDVTVVAFGPERPPDGWDGEVAPVGGTSGGAPAGPAPAERRGGAAHYRSVGAFDGSETSAGRVSADAVRAAVEAALAGRVDALVTAPVHKGALAAAGLPHPGHTELLRDWTGAPAVGMLMAAERTRTGGPLRVLLATTHMALRDVPAALTAERLVEQARLLHGSLRSGWGLAEPRIALCALNPHASDGGLFGDEEARIYGPALERLSAAGVPVTGPLPADTVFVRALDGEFDAVVAPYHDVGMAAFKTSSFGSGVNVTLGLPFPRTSPDHGTAFDLAGKGAADHSSMLEALRLAIRLAGSA